jgi:hypothetical protein
MGKEVNMVCANVLPTVGKETYKKERKEILGTN